MQSIQRLSSVLIILCTTGLFASETDENLWLEEVEGTKALAWVDELNSRTEQTLMTDPIYKSLYGEALDALNRKDKLPAISLKGDWVYNLWKDKEQPRGLYRRASIDSFKTGKPNWQIVLDIDKLSKQDNEKWVFKGMSCLAPANEKCLMNLSPGGTDAHVVREFNTKSLSFVKDGFELPVAKTSASWIDDKHIFVGTDSGPGSLTNSGYPRIQKIWQRGTDIKDAKSVLEVSNKSVSASARHFAGDQTDINLLIDAKSFWTRSYLQIIDGKALTLKLPDTARVLDVFEGKFLVSLKEDWLYEDQNFQQGSALLIEPSMLLGGEGELVELFKQTPNSISESLTVTAKGIIAVTMEDVKSKIYFYKQQEDGWKAHRINLPETGTIEIQTVNSDTGEFFATYEDFLTAPTLYFVDKDMNVSVVMQQQESFDSSNMKFEQHFTLSKDGTRIPYFVVMKKDTEYNGKNPTHIFSYGGFRNSLQPSYSGSYEDLNGAYGNMWLKRGGVYVVANIRGGGEYGPAWHSAALRENKVKSYEDFDAIAEDLIRRKITSPKHLGIEGRSNGGLLVGAAMTRRPDLYGAVICGVPLLDMKRYHKLLAGASWMAEYGDPDTDDWKFMKQYSPYQNLKPGVMYPPVFFFTSTKDDRVHPGHARKMATRLINMGNSVEYFENREGGHKGSSTSEQLAKRIALSFTHLWRVLK